MRMPGRTPAERELTCHRSQKRLYDAAAPGAERGEFRRAEPLGFLSRAAAVYPDKLAVVHQTTRITYRAFYERCRQFADALRRRGITRGETVAVMAPNVPALLEAHYAVPMAGAVLNALNYRLDARSIAFILAQAQAKLLIADREFSPIVKEALAELAGPMPLVEIDDGSGGASLGGTEYEDFLAEGDPAAAWSGPQDEWDPIALNYTSGTTGNPKGVVYHHRGAFLNAIGNAISFGLDRDSVYLWTLPMFHCNGWTYPWAVTAVAGTHVCLRRVEPAAIFPAIAEHRVTHLCGAPIVLNMLVHAPAGAKRRFDHVVEVATGGAAPPSAVIEAMERMGFRVTHLYGLTESYGPSTVCAWQEEWAGLPRRERAARMARQGVTYLTLERQRVVDPQTMSGCSGGRRHVGRAGVAQQHSDEGLSEEPGGDRGGLRAWLVSHRRPRGLASRRVCRDQGPLEGHHHFGRREHLFARSRGGPLPPSRKSWRRRSSPDPTRSGARALAPLSH